MKINCITYIENKGQLELMLKNLSDISTFKKNQLEIIVGTTEITRYTKTSLDEMIDLLNLARKNNLNVVLEWDILHPEEKFQKACHFIEQLPLHDFKAIRVQDPGAVHFIKDKYPWLKMQVILENGNHNLIGLKTWCEYLGNQCERLVLSNELSREVLREYAKLLSTPIEILTFGRLLLFYTPRKLLSPLELAHAKKESLNIEAFGTSEESPHSGFPLIENKHGTFMFNVKDLYLLDHFEELSEMGINHLRIDLRFDDLFDQHLTSIMKLCSGIVQEIELTIKKNHPRPFIKGFYNINKTDILFTKLKNSRTQRNDQNYIGEIVDVERDQQLALMVKVDFRGNDFPTGIKMITPEGKEKNVKLLWVKSSLGELISTAQKNDLVLIPYTNGVTVKTQVYVN